MLRSSSVLAKMPMKKSYKPPRLTNKQQLFFHRHVPYLPYLTERKHIKRQVLLDRFEEAAADGHAFIPDARLPPWRKQVNPELDRAAGVKVNFSGFRVRLAQPQQIAASGFPTHFQ